MNSVRRMGMHYLHKLNAENIPKNVRDNAQKRIIACNLVCNNSLHSHKLTAQMASHAHHNRQHGGGTTTVQHVSHESQTTSHHNNSQPHGSSNKPTYKVYCRAETNHCLSIRNGEVILARANPSDQHQHWYKEEEFSTRVKDAEGLPSFALVNKATGQAIKHATGNTHPVRLTEYKANHLDESILWTESKDTGENYKAIRMANNISLNFDAFHGDKDHGGVHDGTTVVNWEWTKGDNQRWKIVPY